MSRSNQYSLTVPPPHGAILGLAHKGEAGEVMASWHINDSLLQLQPVPLQLNTVSCLQGGLPGNVSGLLRPFGDDVLGGCQPVPLALLLDPPVHDHAGRLIRDEGNGGGALLPFWLLHCHQQLCLVSQVETLQSPNHVNSILCSCSVLVARHLLCIWSTRLLK